MKRIAICILLSILAATVLAAGCTGSLEESGLVPGADSTPAVTQATAMQGTDGGAAIQLPPPRQDSNASLERVLLTRRSVSRYRTDRPLALSEVSQLLWAAQGITGPEGRRTAPSAGRTYPLEVYVVAGNVNDLPAGIYHYLPDGHQLERLAEGDVRQALSAAALDQAEVREAPADIVITAFPERTRNFGDRAERYVFLEAGHAAQNVLLQAVALNLSSIPVGGFNDTRVRSVLSLAENQVPLYIMPVGTKA
ncbi:MAG: SagB/ThcOx family dehydrogenase [Methanomicrobiales archaeon]|nr:SagB/ThcOx family dehydrogenase [Methanomicrobiales archaeon]MDI6875929.1 SagB/ThcOx family dehydrogenase [Methanomicrobiales archaeon]